MTEGLSPLEDSAPLISAAEIRARVAEMSREISTDYGNRTIVAIIVLKGAFIFASDLVRQIDQDLDLEVDFVRASSYGADTVSSGRVVLEGPDPALVAGHDVLLIEDIVDSGLTMGALIRRIQSMGPASVEIAALLSKDRERDAPAVRYLGFHVPDVFVVGYGLDYAQKYRHFPDIRVLAKE
jgi:hypoxanthine phosphoribosyltransferase